MTKENSLLLKGIAILMMLFLHCFNVGINKAICYEDIVISGYPLCDIIARCTSPVDLYIILSGYGLYYKYTKDKHIFVLRRLLKLYALYWLTLLIFVPMLIVHKDCDVTSFSDALLNVIGYKTSFNATVWFLFPYCLIMACSNRIFKYLNQYPRKVLLASFVVSVVGYGISWAGIHKFVVFGYEYFAQMINSLGLLFPFVLGAFMNKEKLIEKFKFCFEDKQCFVVLSFACLTFLRCLTEFSFLVHLAYTCCIILFFCVVRIPMNVRKIFIFLGKLSTVVWFIHAYLLWYLWSGLFYGLKYPPFIFLAIIAVSFICGGAINVIYKKIIEKI